MKITHRGPADADITQVVQGDKSIGQPRRTDNPKTKETSDSSKVHISPAARELQKIAELSGMGDELRAQKVDHLKMQIDQGTYKPDPVEVAKSILRSDVASLLDKE